MRKMHCMDRRKDIYTLIKICANQNAVFSNLRANTQEPTASAMTPSTGSALVNKYTPTSDAQLGSVNDGVEGSITLKSPYIS